ncbi:MAG: reverse transcriptase-like protein [Sphingomonas fennica]
MPPPRPAARRLKIFFDGGCRPHPGPIEVAAVVRGTVHLVEGAGEGDSLAAEWQALLHAARLAAASGAADVLLLGDSAAVIAQANGRVSVRPDMAGNLATYRATIAPIARLVLRHVPRAQNLAGIALARRHPR